MRSRKKLCTIILLNTLFTNKKELVNLFHFCINIPGLVSAGASMSWPRQRPMAEARHPYLQDEICF